MNIIELAKQANGEPARPGGVDWSWGELEAFAKLVVANIDPKSLMSWQEGYEAGAAHEREAIAQMFEGAPALVQFAQNDKGGCLICGFTPKLAIESIRARGTT